jgi:hypothetical protein
MNFIFFIGSNTKQQDGDHVLHQFALFGDAPVYIIGNLSACFRAAHQPHIGSINK